MRAMEDFRCCQKEREKGVDDSSVELHNNQSNRYSLWIVGEREKCVMERAGGGIEFNNGQRNDELGITLSKWAMEERGQRGKKAGRKERERERALAYCLLQGAIVKSNA